MTYLSLAAGAKGAFYFLYQSMPDHPEKLEGLVDPHGASTPMYEAASTLARELKQLSRLLMSLKPTAAGPATQGEVHAGNFVDPAGRQVMIVASTRPDTAVIAKFSVASNDPWRDELTGETLTPADSVLEVKLAPGAGRVLVRR